MSQLRTLIDFMASQNLGYPHYDDWLQKTESQLERGEKKAILAFSDGRLVANLISQTSRDSGLGLLREIKNARVHPEMRDRYFMKFMLRQLAKECEVGYNGMIGDVRTNQADTIGYLIQEGFIPIARTTLYESTMEEVTLFKPLMREAEGLASKIKKVIVAKSI
jgi:N-acetylglutamate synthase-like GNAT family acetyltransferase